MQEPIATQDSARETEPTFAVITTEAMAGLRRRDGRRGRKPTKNNQGLSLFWGISGGSFLGAVGFVLLTLYQQYDNSVTELQRDVKHFNETCADLVKKEELKGRFKMQWEAMEKQAKDLTDKSQRLSLLEHQLNASEEDRKQLTLEVQRLRERLARLEGQHGAAVNSGQ